MKKIGISIWMAAWIGGPAFLPSGEAWSREGEVDARLTMGRAALEDKLYGLAERYFQSSTNRAVKESIRFEAVLGLARAYHGQDRFEDSVALLTPYLQHDLDDGQLNAFLYETARAYFSMERYETVESLLQRLKKIDADIHYLLGQRLLAQTYLATKRIDEALVSFEQFHATYPESDEAPRNLLNWASLLIDQIDEEKALQVLHTLVVNYADHEISHMGKLWLARIYVNRRKWNEAKLLLQGLSANEKVLPMHRAEACMGLADIHEIETNMVEAVEILKKAEALTQDVELRNKARLNRARLMAKGGAVDEGIRLLHESVLALDDRPEAAQAQLDFAELLLALKHYDKAHEEFQNYVEAFSDDRGKGEAFLGKGWSLFEVGRYSEAAAAFAKAYEGLANNDKRVQALLKIADAYFSEGRYEQAQEKYSDFIRQFPDHTLVPQARFQRAECMARREAYPAASEAFEVLIAEFHDTTFAEQACMRLASLHELQGAWEEAIRAYDRVLVEYPQGLFYETCLYNKGLLHYRLGVFEEATLVFDKIKKDFPRSEFAEHAFVLGAKAWFMRGQEDRAMELYNTFLREHGESKWTADVLFWLAEYAYNRADYKRAEDRFLRMNQRHPRHEWADNALYWAGKAAQEQKEYLRAIEHYKALVQRYPESPILPEVRFAQGDALSELGEFSSAILAFEEVIKNFSDSYLVDSAWGRKADCQFTLGAKDPLRYAEALASYEHILESITAGEDLKLQAEYKKGRCHEKNLENQKALESYMNVLYTYLNMREAGIWPNSIWFIRAAFSAAEMKEREESWEQAIQIYERIVDANVSSVSEAQKRIGKIRSKKVIHY